MEAFLSSVPNVVILIGLYVVFYNIFSNRNCRKN